MSKLQLNFLEAAVPLTKVFLPNGEKQPYPNMKNFTSHTEVVSSIEEFHKVLVAHSKQGHCLLKGKLTRNLNNESRANSTQSGDKTQWLCLDFDGLETPDIDDELAKMGIGDVSYVIQYSASHGLSDSMGKINAHIFMLLEGELYAPILKAWLMDKNLNCFKSQLSLSKTGSVLHWPLDITACQNDKLLYIAPPIFKKPLTDPLHHRIRLVKRKRNAIPLEKINETNINGLKADARTHLNFLRKEAGLPARKGQTKWKGPIEYESKPDVCTVTGIKDCGDWVRLNINGGDSWAYCYAKNNPELIHDFKTDTWYLTKELVPHHYAEILADRAESNATPSEDGDLILAFIELKTGEYYKGLWNPGTDKLELYRARDRAQLGDWVMSFGQVPPEFPPHWEITYDPHGDWTVDEENKRINTFKPSRYMKLSADLEKAPKDFPNIHRMIRHFLGEVNDNTALSDHFLNWFAVIFQRKDKPLTAWVNHGVQGTGKGFFMSKVVTPLLGKENVAEVGIGNIEDQFNGWQEGKLFINVNEIDVDDFSAKGRVEARFKMLITDKVMPVRRMRQTMSQEPNFGSYLFSSNKKKPVMIPTDDRRYNVGNRQAIKLVPPSEDDVANELEAFAQWLLAHKADVKLANSIVHTEAREAIQRLSMNSHEETSLAILNGDFDPLWMNMIDEAWLARGTNFNEEERIYNDLIRGIGKQIHEGHYKQSLSRDDMGIIFRRNVGNTPTAPNKLTSFLRNNGIETKKIHHKDRKVYGIHVIWKVSDEIMKELEQEFGDKKPKLRRAK